MKNIELYPKKLTFDEKALKKLLDGAEKVAKAVGSTMGAAGKYVISQSSDMVFPKVTKDGVSVATQIVLYDEMENLGAQLIIQAAHRQVIETGDGTTLTIILANEILKQGIKYIASGCNVSQLCAGIDEAVLIMVKLLEDESIKDISNIQLEKVATISANNDPVLGKIIAEAVLKVGELGIVDCQKNYKDNKIFLEYSDGYQWSRGINKQEFINDPKGLELKEPLILVTDKVIAWGKEMLPLLEEQIFKKFGKLAPPLLIISPDIKGEMLSVIIDSARNKKYFMPWIVPEGLSLDMKYCLEDIAAITGAEFITEESGVRIEDVTLDMLGTCQQLKSDAQKTIIVNNLNLDDRINFLKNRINIIDDEYEIELCKKSLGKLTGGLAIIKVGAASESEQKEIMDRVDDAIRASQAALKEGIIDGGGVALLKLSNNICIDLSSHQDFLAGIYTIKKACKRPISQILENADMEKEFYISSILRASNSFDIKLKTLSTKTMIELDVIDPVKVIRTALINAASVAKLILNSKVILTIDEDFKNAHNK